MKHVAPISTPVIPAIAVDELADLLAKIAPMQARAEELNSALNALGVERIDGTLHTAVISLSERETVDTAALKREHPEWDAPYLKRTLVETLKVTARRAA